MTSDNCRVKAKVKNWHYTKQFIKESCWLDRTRNIFKIEEKTNLLQEGRRYKRKS